MNCKEGAIQLIDEIISTIEVIPHSDYAKSLEVFNQSTLGKHFRHIYDFFHCLVDQCSCQEVDYALRKRDSDIETDPVYVVSKFKDLKSQLNLLDESTVIDVHADFQLMGGLRPKVQSTIGRELMYAYDHAVHHLAIVKIGIKALNKDLPVNKHLGVAASTIMHQYEIDHGH